MRTASFRCIEIFVYLYLFFTIFVDDTFSKKRKRKEKRDYRPISQVRPNIIFVLADDLDVVLGSPEVMSKTKRILREEGVEFINAFTTSPICCPSRSSILTGRYAHNHNVQSNNKNCSGPEWHNGPEKETFGKLMQDVGYKTAYFGKYLNNYDGSYVPPGWDEWLGLIRNSRFYNYTVNSNGRLISHRNDYEKDYFTNVITEAGIEYFTRNSYSTKPILMVLALSAPHGPEDAAPQYQDRFPNVKAPRLPSYNFTAVDKHWIIRTTPPLNNVTARFTDVLHRKRLQTLLSVDDAIENLYLMLLKTGQLQNTYFIFSSDHGYHLGQFSQIKGKSQPYDSDIRIPLYMRGPYVPSGKRIEEIALNIDFAATFLDIAGADVPANMDGLSLLDVSLDGEAAGLTRGSNRMAWRDTFLVERGKIMSLNEEQSVNDRPPRLSSRKAGKICSKMGFPKPPCTPEKKFVCVNRDDLWHLQPCGLMSFPAAASENCACPKPTAQSTTEDESEEADESHEEEEDESEPVESEHLQFLLQQLKKQFGKLRRRIKRHGVRYLHKISTQKLDAPGAYSVNGTEDLTDSILAKVNATGVGGKVQDMLDRKITKTMHRLQVLQLERQKVLQTRALREHLKQTFITEVQGGDSKKRLPSTTPRTVSASHLPVVTEDGDVADPNATVVPARSCSCPPSFPVSKKVRGGDMNCFRHHKNHWKTPPLWDGPSFTACTNSPNSSYWCLRTINSTHNFLYCEFVTGFKEYYDILKDPYQLKNVASSVPDYHAATMSSLLASLKICRGSRACFAVQGMKVDVQESAFGKLRRPGPLKRGVDFASPG